MPTLYVARIGIVHDAMSKLCFSVEAYTQHPNTTWYSNQHFLSQEDMLEAASLTGFTTDGVALFAFPTTEQAICFVEGGRAMLKCLGGLFTNLSKTKD